MKSALAVSLLAFCASHSVLAAPAARAIEATLVETAENYETSLQQPDLPPIALLEDLLPEESQHHDDSDPLPQEAQPFDLFGPPPIFDPEEPRPQSIFITPQGDVWNALPKPPPISFTRPERLSAFDAGIHPKDSPYPPDFLEPEHDPRFYPCPMWHTLFKLSAAITVLLFAATASTMIIERMIAHFWRRARGRRSSQSRGILEVDPLLDEKRRSRSDSTRSSIWSRSQSPPKISLA
jgi:hypothetical protein